MAQQENTNLSTLLAFAEPPTSSGGATDFDPSLLAVRTISSDRFVFNSGARQIELVRSTRTLVAQIEWTEELFDEALRYNVLASLPNYYRFVKAHDTPVGLLSDSNTSDTLSPDNSIVFSEWAAKRRKRNKEERQKNVDPESIPTNGEVLTKKVARFRRFAAQIDSDKIRLRGLQQRANVTSATGMDTSIAGSNAEISRVETAIEDLNRSAIQVYNSIETALVQLNELSGAPTVSSWLVQLPDDLDFLTRLNAERPPEMDVYSDPPLDEQPVSADDESEEAEED
jgi:hypothetical protein